MQSDSLIVTAKMDFASSEVFDAMRQKHFPPEKNFLKAHITLFHHLPGDLLDEIEGVLKITASRQYEFKISFPNVKLLGRGTAIEVGSAELVSLRNKLVNHWIDYLTPQDRQKFVPHITIQNKVSPEKARRLYEELNLSWQASTGKAVGIQLWHYRGGPWQLANEFDFYKLFAG